MAGFGDRCNAWRVARGQAPLAPEEIAALNEAGAATAKDLREHQEEYVAEITRNVLAILQLSRVRAGPLEKGDKDADAL